jgi:hypothetical protein
MPSFTTDAGGDGSLRSQGRQEEANPHGEGRASRASQTMAAGGLARLLASEFLLAALNCFRLRQEVEADKSLALARKMAIESAV